MKKKISKSQKNPEFIRRLADAELNPGLARRIPDPDARLEEAQALADQFSLAVDSSAELVGCDSLGCCLKVTVTCTYNIPDGWNAHTLPHGIYVKVWPQAEILSSEVISGGWFFGSTKIPDSSNKFVYWVKNPPGNDNYSRCITSAQVLEIRIRFTGGFCLGNYSAVVRVLDGRAFDDGPDYWIDEDVLTVSPPIENYNIGENITVCEGKWLTLHVLNAPAGSTVKWYRYEPSLPTDPIPSATCPLDLYPGGPWVWQQTDSNVPPPGGSHYNTQPLDKTKYYVAVVEHGCSVTVTDPIRVEVCPRVTDNIIQATNPPLASIDGVPHACLHYPSLHLFLNPLTFPCSTTTVLRWRWRTRTLTNTIPCHPHWSSWSGWNNVPNSAGWMTYDTDPMQITSGCQQEFEYQAIVKSPTCPPTLLYPSYSIVIDRPLSQVLAQITAVPSVLCPGTPTLLTYPGLCGNVVRWEMRQQISSTSWGPWTTIDGSGSTCVFWTINLDTTSQFRVRLKNGKCPQVFSLPCTVFVRPILGVIISKDQEVPCVPGVTLTAQTIPSNIIAHFQWFQNGQEIGVDFFKYSPTSGGNYYVEVFGTSDACGPARSNVITICEPQVVIHGDCCICPGKTVQLQAEVIWSPVNCPGQSCTFNWFRRNENNVWIGIGSGPIISVDSPGFYRVEANYGTCPAISAEPFHLRLCQGIFLNGPDKNNREKPVRHRKK